MQETTDACGAGSCRGVLGHKEYDPDIELKLFEEEMKFLGHILSNEDCAEHATLSGIPVTMMSEVLSSVSLRVCLELSSPTCGQNSAGCVQTVWSEELEMVDVDEWAVLRIALP